MATTLDDPGGPGDFDDYELIRPEDFLAHNPFPPDARRSGIDQYTGDNGALIALAASLDPAKLSHRLVAWLLLLAVVCPLVFRFWVLL